MGSTGSERRRHDVSRLPATLLLSAQWYPNGEVSWPLADAAAAINALASVGLVILGLDARRVDERGTFEVAWSAFEPVPAAAHGDNVEASKRAALARLPGIEEFGDRVLITWARLADPAFRPPTFSRPEFDAWVATDPYHRLRSGPDISDEQCSCLVRPALRLTSGFGPNPIRCMRCSGPVVPESIPIPVEMVDEVARWGAVANAIFALDLDSAEYERFAFGEQEDIGSPLNRRGRAITDELNKVQATFMWWSRSEQLIRRKHVPPCPACGGPMVDYLESIIPVIICEPCRIATDRGDQFLEDGD